MLGVARYISFKLVSLSRILKPISICDHLQAYSYSSQKNNLLDSVCKDELFDHSENDVDLDETTLRQLQRWSLVKLDDARALHSLKNSIRFANKILDIDTEGVEPLYTVLENK